MSTDHLRAAVRDAGASETAQTVALLHVAGEQAYAAADPACLLYAALAGTLRRDVIGLDPLLVGATVAATDRRPDAVTGVLADLLGGDDDQDHRTGLVVALAREVTLAADDAGQQAAQWQHDLDGLGGDAA